ncbi:MAG: NAD-dependent epimerase/dehydratase family protein [Cytophagales bacterium]|nr:MAG: NAD-dependent epimerase/dehydratase family protein [Cytophagales bacterium]
MKSKVIITGASGMVGEGVLHECILHHDIDEILVIGRKSSAINHPKVKEIIHSNFFDLSPIAHLLKGYDACFFCLGVSSVGMKEPDYYKLTYTLTLHVASILCNENPNMTFSYISGVHSDSSEKGTSMWARVKGKTENDLMKLPFRKVYNFRPGYLHPTKGLKNTQSYYQYIAWMFPLLLKIAPKYACTLKQLGLAMINAHRNNYPSAKLEVKDIVRIAQG